MGSTSVFLLAFGVAFAAVWVQGVLRVPSSVNVQTAAIVSGDTMWMLWKDKEMTTPFVSGDTTAIEWRNVRTQPPLRRWSRTAARPFYIENISGKFARPIKPCTDILVNGIYPGHVSAGLQALLTDEERREQDDWRGDTCDNEFRGNHFMSPGELWRVHPHLGIKQDIPDGTYFFDVFIGGVAVTGDAASGPAEFLSGN